MSSKKRNFDQTEERSGIGYHLEKRRRMRMVGKDKALPSYVLKPEAIDFIQKRLLKNMADAGQMWKDFVERLTTYIQDNKLLCKKTSEDRERVDAQMLVFAQMEENKHILDAFPEDLRKQILNSLEVSSRNKLKRSSNHPHSPSVTQRPQTPISDDIRRATVSHKPVIYTSNMGRTEASLIDVDYIKIDSSSPVMQRNLNFEQYLGHVERSTGFTRYKHVLFVVLPPLPGSTEEALSKIVDEADWTTAIIMQLHLDINYLRFTYFAPNNVSTIPLAVTMNRGKSQRLRAQDLIDSEDAQLHRELPDKQTVTVGD